MFNYRYGYKIIVTLGLVSFFATGCSSVSQQQKEDTQLDNGTIITSFTQCVNAGHTIQESFPRVCITPQGTSFTEYVGNVVEKQSLIQLTSPMPNEAIASPLTITGQARGYWFFEASFPVVLTDWDGLIIAEGVATADGEWMTEEFVPFTASLTFTVPSYGITGTLILKKANASGLPEHDDALELPITF